VHYIFDNSDATTVIFGREFSPIVAELYDRLPKVRRWLVVEDGAQETVPAWAESFEALAAKGDGKRLGITRSPNDLLFIYTGGTTGMPKGVMWRHDAQRRALLNPALVERLPQDLDDHLENVRASGRGPISVPACPLMHGTGLVTAMSALFAGGTVVTLESANFDAQELWAAVDQHRVTQIAISGDAFSRPMLRALEEAAGRYDVSCVVSIVSSGIMWSSEVKEELLHHLPQANLLDSFGSTEAVGFGLSIMTAESEARTARFQIGPNITVFSVDGRQIPPGSGEAGLIASYGPLPEGYYKDPQKTAETFKMIDGVRYSMPGDFCTVEADGTLTLLGRGSGCINTAGEKVFPEEVEEVLKLHPDVEDALVVGVPDNRWGQAVTGVVELREGAVLDEAALRVHVRKHLAGFKTPKRLIAVPRMLRSPNGKADYKEVHSLALRTLGITP
jgi:acyl-CoA synthetase (AMP-forming)/AMP-acid ligase II